MTFSSVYETVIKGSVECRSSEEAAALAQLAKLYRRAHEVVSTPQKPMSYEDRCLRTANLERILSGIQRILNIRAGTDRNEVADMYEKVAFAIKKYKSLRPDTSEWYGAFVEALKASITVARFENQESRADKYNRVIPMYDRLRHQCAVREGQVPCSFEWHDSQAAMFVTRKAIASIEGNQDHVRIAEAREALHRDASMVFRLNSSLRLGSLAWFANAEKLHHVVRRLEADPETISTLRPGSNPGHHGARLDIEDLQAPTSKE